jgi:hypothetical protein
VVGSSPSAPAFKCSKVDNCDGPTACEFGTFALTEDLADDWAGLYPNPAQKNSFIQCDVHGNVYYGYCPMESAVWVSLLDGLDR